MKNMKKSLYLFALALGMSVALSASALTVQEVDIPMAVKGLFGESRLKLAATEYRPDGNGPFPLVVINHGSPRTPAERTGMTAKYRAQSMAFVARGFVVLNPLRRGYGKSDGPWAEDYDSCNRPKYYEAGLESARDIAATIDYAKTRSYVDPHRIVLVGQSAGGFAALALASENPDGVLGVINFAGGRGSRGPNNVCNSNRLVNAFTRYAATTKVPMLWFYAENDLYFGPALAQRFAQAYRNQNRNLRFVALPANGEDGHLFFSAASNVDAWTGEVDAFMNQIGAVQKNGLSSN